MTNLIAVSGAMGGLGSQVIEHLLRLVPASRVAVSVRHPKTAAALDARGVRVRRGDFDDPATLDAAFEGADRVFVISTLSPNERRFVQQRNAIDAARRAGARTVLYTSVLQRRGSVFAATPGHVDTEDYLERSEGSFTIVRNAHYMENLPMFLGSAILSGDLALPPDGPTSWVARADLGEGIARLLVDDFAGRRTICLTGPEALDFEQIAAIASRAFGRTITRRTVAPGEYVDVLVTRGLQRQMAELLATGFASRAAGELATVDGTLARILGRPLKTVEETLPRLLTEHAKRPPGRVA